MSLFCCYFGEFSGCSAHGDPRGRYLAASGWTNKFFGSSVPEAIASTIAWRKEKNIAGITASEIMAEAQSGKLYVNGFDRQGRPILYYRLGREATHNPEKHLKLLARNRIVLRCCCMDD